MSIDDAYEILIVFSLILSVAFIWIGIIRPFSLRIVKYSLFRLRDDLRDWYAALPEDRKISQNFSFLFMERAINSVVDSAGDVTVWRIKYLRELNALGRGFSPEFEEEIKLFLSNLDSNIENIDDQHTLIFICLLFINSPIEFLVDLFSSKFASINALAQGTDPIKASNVNLIRDISHQQSPLQYN
jgi:hypothetical protein